MLQGRCLVPPPTEIQVRKGAMQKMAFVVKGVQDVPASLRRGVDVEAPATSSRGIQ